MWSGDVERSETKSTPEGERHSATIRLKRGGLDEGDEKKEERREIRTEINKAADKSEQKMLDREAKAKSGKSGVEIKE